ncbi:MAG: glycosyltransferase [Thermoproteota archaeon]
MSIGSYAIDFAKAVVKNRSNHEIILALNALFPETVETIRSEFFGLIPQENIRVWYAPGPLRACDPENEWRRQVAEHIREAFLASLKPDIVHITSFFEGWRDDGVTSIGVFDKKTSISVTIHDLDIQQIDKNSDAGWHSKKLEQLRNASLVAVLSESSRRRLIKDFRFSEDKIVVSQKAVDLVKIWESSILQSHEGTKRQSLRSQSRPRLAYISPLPPEKSGVSDYSAALLPALSQYYQVEVIVVQKEVADEWIKQNCPIRDVLWFEDHFDTYDRVLYHIGNAQFHIHMFEILEKSPGVVVLHDFFLSHVLAHMEFNRIGPYSWTKSLYDSHGYKAIEERFKSTDTGDVIWKFPCNLKVIKNSLGIIVHSEYSRKLAISWYGKDASEDWMVIPMVRNPYNAINRVESRELLKINPGDFVVCSFGMLGPSKLNHRLVDAWLKSRLSGEKNCRLIFVGENNRYDYGNRLLKTIKNSRLGDRIQITGWVDERTFHIYLACADVAVQLRSMSRGETSAAILDCMNYGIPTIVNAHGSSAELPRDAVWMLPDEFDDQDLVRALETLWKDSDLRTSLGEKAKQVVASQHNPSICAQKYFEAIETFYEKSETGVSNLIKQIGKICSPEERDVASTASAIVLSFYPTPRKAQLLVDVTATAKNDLKTGIERAARAIVRCLIESTPSGYRVEPVYLSYESGRWQYRYARKFTLGLLDCPDSIMNDEIVDPQPEDVILGVDISGDALVNAQRAGLFSIYRNLGVRTYFIIHDLLPLLFPEFFPPGADTNFEKWLRVVASFDGAICVSRATAETFVDWLKTNYSGLRPYNVAWNHHGADIEKSSPSKGLPKDASRVLKELILRPTFLMVGTVEPRKGYLQTLRAFTNLWHKGLDVNLVIVGKEGWTDLPDQMRRTIPSIVKEILSHPELGKRLFWLKGISDEYLDMIYKASTCLLMASEAEGFGLPLIEAARYGLPLIARHIPVFYEIAGDHAFYFPDDKSPEVLSEFLEGWLSLYREGNHPRSNGVPWLTWEQSVRNLLEIVLQNKWSYRVMSNGTIESTDSTLENADAASMATSC